MSLIHPHSFQVYYPCILASKKRYVGAMYETVEQQTSHFDAKVTQLVSLSMVAQRKVDLSFILIRKTVL